MEEFHFLRPFWLLALIPAVWLLYLLWCKQTAGSVWHTVFDAHLLSRLWLESPGKSTRLPVALLAVGWILAIVLLAGPVWERHPEPFWQAQLSRILILDLSSSMDARDLTPSRVERARFKIRDILDRSREGRTGLVVFAGEAHVVTPLTEDIETVKNLVAALHTDIMPATGNFAAPALQLAGELLDLKGILSGELLLITDGIDDPSATLELTRRLREEGHRLSILGVGTDFGGAIMKDGVAEVTRFHAEPLQQLAHAGGGAFSRLTTDDSDLKRLLPEIHASDAFDPLESSMGGVKRWVEYGVWLMPLIVLLAAIAFRRGWLMGLALFVLPQPPAYAFSWKDLWLRADQQAQTHLQQGDAQTAAQQFNDPHWRGTALYEAGDYTAAARAFAESEGIEARYNRGNALARAGDLQSAINVYRDVLQVDPGHEDAQANLELLEKLMQDQQQQGGESTPDDQAEQRENTDNGDQADEQSGDKQNEQPDTSKTERDDSHEDDNSDNSNDTSDADNDGLNENDHGQDQQDDMADDSAAHTAMQSEQDNPDEQHDAGAQQQLTPEHAAFDNEQRLSEEDIALEQWLRQIPEDPSGLLRRKFMLEHIQRRQY